MTLQILPLGMGAIVGMVLALTGAGGGILTIPLLVFGMHLSVQQAGPIGLMAVGIASAAGAAVGLRRGIVRYRAAAVVGAMGMLIAPLGVFVAHQLPNRPLLILFSLVLIYSALRLLNKRPMPDAVAHSKVCTVGAGAIRLSWTPSCVRVMLGTGMISGFLSGLIGVGGGFVIVPAFIRYTNLGIKSIQATSLAVIALVSVSGVSAAALQGSVQWSLALPFSAGAILAMLAGQQLVAHIDARMLQKIFAWTTLSAAALLLARALGWLNA